MLDVSEHGGDGMEWLNIRVIHELSKRCTCDSVMKINEGLSGFSSNFCSHFHRSY